MGYFDPPVFTVQSRPVLVEGFGNNVHVPGSELMVVLVGTRYSSVLNPLSNSLPSDLFPNGLWEPGPILENDHDEIYQGYSERFAFKFPAQCQVV